MQQRQRMHAYPRPPILPIDFKLRALLQTGLLSQHSQGCQDRWETRQEKGKEQRKSEWRSRRCKTPSEQTLKEQSQWQRFCLPPQAIHWTAHESGALGRTFMNIWSIAGGSTLVLEDSWNLGLCSLTVVTAAIIAQFSLF
ncbi:hypothetical protein Y1Q_0002356 [Alligator mississippiensis]|uniref:Uncharacterized protein n=1 Tax=Alligator mississippiensis TaxID=8496 RepID=A0A151MGV5_ALLMI|nr:hypothetical protein Y1Q_0002356 [Alligator mississippiensis]